MASGVRQRCERLLPRGWAAMRAFGTDRPLQFVQGGLVSRRGAAIRVNVLCFEGLLSALSQMIPRWFRLETGTRLLPGVVGEHCSFRSRPLTAFGRLEI